MFEEFCGPANIIFHISLNIENKMKKIFGPKYSL